MARDHLHDQLFASLTDRQREVLALVAGGATNAQVAERLGVSLDGAKWHLREIFARLGVDSREEAAVAWRAHTSLPARARRVAHAFLGLAAWKTVAAGTGVAGVAAGGAVVMLVAAAAAQGDASGAPPDAATPGTAATVGISPVDATPGSQQVLLAPTPPATGTAASPSPRGTPYPAATPPGSNSRIVPATPSGAGGQRAGGTPYPNMTPAGAATPPPAATSAQVQLNPGGSDSPMRDRRVRRALLSSVPGIALEPVGDVDFPQPLAFDPEDAKRQLVAAGYPDIDFVPTFIVPDLPESLATARALQTAWHRELGLSVVLVPLDIDTFRARLAAGDEVVAAAGLAASGWDLALLP